MELQEELSAVRREIELEAPADAVWDRLASPEGLARWLGDEVALDAVRPGATGVVVEDGVRRPVEIEEVDDGRRLAYRWNDPERGPSLVELTLTPEGEQRTRLVVVELPATMLEQAIAVSTQPAARADGGAARRGPSMLALA